MNARALSWHLNINILSICAQYWGRQGKVLDKVSSEDNTAGIRLDSGRLGTGSNATNQDTRLKEKPSLIFSYNRNVFIQILIVDIGVNSLL